MSSLEFVHAKRYGQNFLTTPATQQKIIDAFTSHYDSASSLVEIGPGVGDLTQFLVSCNPLLVEIDSRAVAVLQTRFPTLQIRCTDALHDLENLAPYWPQDFYLFSNLPYNVGSRILIALSLAFPQTPFTVILQEEVALKTKPEGHFTLFGAWLNFVWETRVLFKISRGNFTPAPRVDSALLQGAPRNGIDLDLPLAFAILKKLLIHPKKTLANNLKNLGWDKAQVERFLITAALPPTTRLTWTNYAQILRQILAFR